MKTIFIYSLYIFVLKLEILSYDVLVKYQLPITDSLASIKPIIKNINPYFLVYFCSFVIHISTPVIKYRIQN